MAAAWFLIVALMVVAYVVLDGFDIGAGIIHLIVARTPDERRTVIRSIGPVWDGNEVWLLAAGGTLYFAFPLLHASSFSGFYLPLMMVLWLLMLRAIGLEMRNHVENEVWHKLFDAVFSGASVLLAIFFGAALGNVIRGVPLRADGYFFEALWTNWRVGPEPGILDWYTVIAGVVALCALLAHGALYVASKTEDYVNARSRTAGLVGTVGLMVLTPISLWATLTVRPGALHNYVEHPIGFAIPVLVVTALGGMWWFNREETEKLAFACSCVYLAAMLGGAAFGLFPYVLPSSSSAHPGLTIHNASAAPGGLAVGFVWWPIGMVLAITYFVFIYRRFSGKVRLEAEEGY
jgi:cytochrome d ubiquinol oxidase subunit II